MNEKFSTGRLVGKRIQPIREQIRNTHCSWTVFLAAESLGMSLDGHSTSTLNIRHTTENSFGPSVTAAFTCTDGRWRTLAEDLHVLENDLSATTHGRQYVTLVQFGLYLTGRIL